jgi:GDP/UDP-N,N'-diacetylbacillosamine 2-epimerase (hydrolysing)
MKKKILIFTGSRADYGLMKNLIFEIKKQKKINCEIVAGSAHYSKYFGSTYKEIEDDKLKINYPVKINFDKLYHEDVIDYISKSLKIFKAIIKKSSPDLVVVLGDRFEVFSFVQAAFFMKIKIAHIHGGEVTSGAFDDNIRHAITKFSNYHFATHKTYKKRLIQLGENSKNIYLVGSPGVENFKKYKLIDKKKLFKELSLNFEDKKILITFHPETNSDLEYEKQINIILESIKDLKKEQLIFTFNNSDPYGHIFLKKIKKYITSKKNIRIFSSLGSLKYLSLLKNVDLVIGNSSSGVIEAPAAKVPTLNIGTRQKGRVVYDSIINCELNSNKIKNVINRILYKKIKKKKYIIDNFNTSELIYSKLYKILYKNNFEKKIFYDIKFKK